MVQNLNCWLAFDFEFSSKKGPLRGPVAVGTFSKALLLCFEREKPDKRRREVSSLRFSAPLLEYRKQRLPRVTPPLSPERTSNSVVGKQYSSVTCFQ